MSDKKKSALECVGRCYALKCGGPTMVCESADEYDGETTLKLKRYEVAAGSNQGRFETEDISLCALKEAVQ